MATSTFKMRLNIFHFNNTTLETLRITQALWWQLSCFYQMPGLQTTL